MTKTDVATTTTRRKMELAPSVLKWARERADLSIDDLAKKIRTKPQRVEEWEATGQLSRNHAEKLARYTHTPFGYLFMKKPIIESLPIVDFRTHKDYNQLQIIASPGLLSTIYHMQNRQEWMRSYMLEFDIKPPTFVGQYKNKPIPVVSDAMHKTLGLCKEWFSEHSTLDRAFSHLIGRIDEIGIMAIVDGTVRGNTHHKLDPNEFQGFALVDDYAPLIFVNGADYKAAQMFTVAHELAHIFIGAEGLSSLNKTLPLFDNKVERRCNKIAAEFLIPSDALFDFMSKKEHGDNSAAKYYKVSRIMTMRRMSDAGVIGKRGFDIIYSNYAKHQQLIRKKNGGNYWHPIKYRIGERFGKAIVLAVAEGRLSYTDAYSLTGIRGGAFERYAQRMC